MNLIMALQANATSMHVYLNQYFFIAHELIKRVSISHVLIGLYQTQANKACLVVVQIKMCY